MIGRHIQALENRRMLSATMTGTTLKVTGTSGADAITLEKSQASIKASIGSDTATYSLSIITRIIVSGLGGNDTINVKGSFNKRIIISGGEGDDTIYGSNRPEQIHGDLGNDVIFGGAGNDTINGDAGDDLLYGGYGDDTVKGGIGNDTLAGDDEDVLAFDSKARKQVYGDDLLIGGEGDDWLISGIGNARMKDPCGNDTLIGEAGADILDARSSAVIVDKVVSQGDVVPRTDSPAADAPSAVANIHLTIRIKNSKGLYQNVVIPGGVGYFSKNTPSYISTNPNATDGVFTLKKAGGAWTLKDIFKIWGVSIGTTHVGKYLKTPTNTLTVKVNDATVSNFMTYQLPMVATPATEVVIQLG